ncbi:hypothetical protein [Microbacterium sp. zg.Y909]|uniref:hypothetical protein n=1 Tax=Microbacterium sp. zg.Y909 TaxID=2969413 RepID=UPI00214B29F0|nr:hypothetical protein [Microbacterium sp. zg.Y909]MCR2824972.1 hypothetical protein [Microbacterium sp. zg.Y909]
MNRTRKGVAALAASIALILAGSFLPSPAVAAASGEGAVRVATTANFYGVQGTFTVPSGVYVEDHPTDPTKHGYVAFYLGLAETCEGGISYTPSVGWKKFLNCGPNTPTTTSNMSVPLSTQPSPGTTFTVKLVNNLDNTASLYISGTLQYTLTVASDRTLTAATPVKMVHSTFDPQDVNRYTGASWSNATVKNADGTYTAFPSSIQSNLYPWGKGDYSVPSLNPLQTSLLG